MSGRWTPPRLLEAIGDLCNGTIDLEAGQELDALLASDAQARRVYTNYMWSHACLYAENGALAAAFTENDAADSSEQDQLHTIAPRVTARWASWLWLAAAFAGVAAASSWSALNWKERQLAVRNAAEHLQNDAEAVARITGTHNCIWSNPETAAAYGSPLHAGQKIELAEGLAEVTFADGATLLLEGPATFHVTGSGKVDLHAGRMAAVVPQRARDFHVRTATLDLFDVGTEFGLVAQESGAAEVHVFNGLVKADVLDSNGRALRRLELRAAQAARVSPLSTSVVEFPANDAGFVRNMTPAFGPHDGLLAEEGFRYPDGPLEAQNGGFGWAGPWFTTSADDAAAGPDSNRVLPGSLAAQGIVPVG
ncbi:MAG TPA: FecR domain-containing protein, partial [Pirellulales bacterium]